MKQDEENEGSSFRQKQHVLTHYKESGKTIKPNKPRKIERNFNCYKIPRLNITKVLQSLSISSQFKTSSLSINDPETQMGYNNNVNSNSNFNNNCDHITLSTSNAQKDFLLKKNLDLLLNQLFFSKITTPFTLQPNLMRFNSKGLQSRQFNNFSDRYVNNSLQLESRKLTTTELRNYVSNSQSTTCLNNSKETEKHDHLTCSRQRRLINKESNQYITAHNMTRSQSKTQFNQSNIDNMTLPLIHKDNQISEPLTSSLPSPKQSSIKTTQITRSIPTATLSLNKEDITYYTPDYNYYIIYPENCGYVIKKCMSHRINWRESLSQSTSLFNFQWSECSNKINYPSLSSNTLFKQCVNHYEYHSSISNKESLFINLLSYCEEINKEVFQYIPFTLIFNHQDQPLYDSTESFKKVFSNIQAYLYDYAEIANKVFSRRNTTYAALFPLKLKGNKKGIKTNIMIPRVHYNEKNLWIFKTPKLNRGRCIKLINSIELLTKYIKQSISGNLEVYSNDINNGIKNDNDKNVIDDSHNKYHSNRIILQKYIEKPLLYYNRKFDIRIWVLITHQYDVYAFKEGHLKTCSINYNLNDINSYAHITNYSLQKYNTQFGKYEMGNEVSFDSFQQYLDEAHKDKAISVKRDLFSKMKEIIELTTKSVRNILNINNRQHCFEIFGYDFMIDELFNIFLIEINTNPGLEESSSLIKKIIPRMIDDSLRLTIDVLYNSKYADEYIDSNSKEYISPYNVKGYDDRDNLWDFVCSLNKKEDKNNNINSKIKHKKFKVHKRKKIKMVIDV